MPSRPTALALAVLLVLAGCSGASDRGATPNPETTPPASTAAPTGAPGTTIPAAEVVDYRDLPNGTQRSVRATIENGSTYRDPGDFEGLTPDEDEYLRYDGTTYVLDWSTTLTADDYSLERVEAVDGSAVESNESVIAYGNLSPTGRRIFDRARNGSRAERYAPGAFPDAFTEHRYVDYRGQHFRLVVLHADVIQVKLRVEPVDPTSNG